MIEAANFNDWNCRCDVTEVLRTRARPTDLQQRGPMPQIAEGFKSNVGKSGQVFDATHPYFGGVPQAEQTVLKQLVAQTIPLDINPEVLAHLDKRSDAWGARIQDELLRRVPSLTPETGRQLIAAAQANLERLVADKVGRIRTGGPSSLEKQYAQLESILKGRFKSQFETGTSGGILSKSQREEVERQMFGYAAGQPPKTRRPIYGFLSDANTETRGAQYYGDLSIRLKAGALNRATITGGDSLDGLYAPSPVRRVRVESFIEKNDLPRIARRLNDLTTATRLEDLTDPYFELQFHNQLNAAAIETVYVPNLTKVPDSIRELCRKKGIGLEQHPG